MICVGGEGRSTNPSYPQNGAMLTEHHASAVCWYPFGDLLFSCGVLPVRDARGAGTARPTMVAAAFTDDAYRVLGSLRSRRAPGISVAERRRSRSTSVRRVLRAGDHAVKASYALLKSPTGSQPAGSPASTTTSLRVTSGCGSSYDLAMVARGEGDAGAAPTRSSSPAHTLTGGLRDLITRAVHRLPGDQNASQHQPANSELLVAARLDSMLRRHRSSWPARHGTHPQETFRDLLAAIRPRPPHPTEWRRWSAITWNPRVSNPSSVRGRRSTRYEESQSGNSAAGDAHEIVAEADRTSTNPGDSAAAAATAALAPAVILIDEWVVYARRRSHGRDDLPGASSDAQFPARPKLSPRQPKPVPGAHWS